VSDGVLVEFKVHLGTGRTGRRELRLGDAPEPVPVAGVPRVARLMALAIRFEDLVREGEVEDFADIAASGRVTRARVSQIGNLVNLAPDLQEAVLGLTCSGGSRSAVTERQIRAIAAEPDWQRQREMWELLRGTQKTGPGRVHG
jgi:hypothetical protein